MNKIYRRLWSTARQCWVVASELTSPRGKPASSVGAAVLIVTASLVPGAGVGTAGAVTYHACQNPEQIILNCVPFMAHVPSMAQNTLGPNTSSYMMLGAGSHMQGRYSSLFGNWSSSVGDNNAVFGFDARARQGGSAVFGARSVADGFGAVAVGTYAHASGQFGIAMGYAARTVDNGGGISRIAIGNDSYAGTPGWTGAIAFGGLARAEYDGVALGYEAQAKGAGSVALGRGAVATESYVVSVGNAAAPRRVVYVADGNVSQHSMDAVNGRQLLGVKETAERALDNSKLVTQASASGQIRVGAENSGTVLDVRNRSNANRKISGVADAALSTTSTEAVTGKQLHATNQRVSTATSTANAAKASADAAVGRIGAAAVALGQAAVAEGSGSTASAALGSAAKAYNGNGVAMGADARAGVNDKGEKSTAATGAVAIGALSRSGNGAVAAGLRASAIGDRAVALGNDANAAGTHATAVGYKATASANQATAVGREASASGTFSTALGNLASARAESAVALGDRAVAAHTDSVALGNGSQTTAGNQISVGNDTLKRKIVNVADGALNTSSAEAVTGKQLNATNVEVASVRTTAASAQTTAGAAKTAADDALAKANALGGLVGQTSVTGNVRLGSENTGTVLDVRNKSNASRKVTGVADATLSTSSTEAVSGKQLNATNTEVASVRSAAANAQTTANVAQTTADSAFAKARATGNAVATAADVNDANKATATGHLAMAMGNVAKASGVATVAVGNNANAVGTNAISIGSASGATSQFALALGGNAKATHENAVALGEKSVTGGTNQVSIGNATLKRKLVNVADATLSSTSTDAVTGKQVFAVDQKVTANQSLLASHATELTGHEARIAGNRRELDDLRTEFDNFDPDLEGVVRYAADGSVDMDGGKVRGVAAGDISSAGSTDAVNGGQLFVTNQRLSQVEETAGYIAIGHDDESIDAKAGEFSVAIGDGAEAGEGTDGATAIGAFSRARGKGSVALGRASFVDSSAENGFALGTGSSVHSNEGVALGGFARIESGAEYSVALGASSTATEENVVSVGNLTRKRRIVNLARGRGAEDAVTVGQLGDSLAALGGGAGIDPGGNIILPTYKIQGGSQNNVEDALNVLDGAVVAGKNRADRFENQLRSVLQDSPATRSDGLGQLNLAGANGMVLGNVANGLIAPGSRDAVNGGQLYAAEQKIERNRNDLDGLREKLVGGAEMQVSDAAGLIDFAGARLTGVADGELNPGSSDVVTGRQLYDTNRSLERLAENSNFLKFGDSIDRVPARAGRFAIAMGDSAEASLDTEGAVALGAYAVASGTNSVALGRAAHVHEGAARGFALGTESQVAESGAIAIGAASAVLKGAVESVAIGAQSVARESHTVSFGNDGMQRRLVNVARGRNANDAATVGQLRGALATLGSDVDANGNIVGPTFNVQGGSQHTLGDALNALDGAVITAGTRVDRVENQLRSVFQDSPATRSDGLGQLNLAGANGMVLGNVANGLIAPGSRDAINGGQLHAMEQRLDGRIDGLEQRVDATPEGRALASASAPTPPAAPEAEGPAGASGEPAAASAGRAGGGIASADGGGTPAPADAPAPTPQVNTADLEKMLARANEYTDGAISNFERRLDKMDKRFNRMAAMSSAQTAMAMNTAGLATYNRLGAGVGYAEGESAMAVGYQRVLNDKGSATFSLNGAFTNSGERSMGVGVGIGW
ncbi:TPA: ESPR-type extended signal peptide-containing protein [Stenotrophomonas maltophilia]|uniref:YadA-like family protein n=4 Tax=Gammaproteobacteria TaxID=1236 RepID=A0AAI9CEK7_STEMA|nr:ESPR-type extended signal peptide-containing protein [Stenotrophomonas maltophilia]EKT4443450.1 YadA-like family protein [Stenotrophomonas maltophilia]MBN5013830.1 YadA-like family protein [Stenotrophomonas maltophilia]HDS1306248.1 YadA-like family protein [Stenotrophomonas maltophilia]HDS1821200.1 YadA-like family protein [Stenotrophomonas maltophilia]HDX0920656.1 YadA-like family protein [Stenotrophomonas maltophilia]